MIVSHIYNFYATPANTIDNLKRQKRRLKALDNQEYLYLFTTIIKNNAKTVKKLKKIFINNFFFF